MLSNTTALKLGIAQMTYGKSDWTIADTKIPTGEYTDTLLNFSIKTEF